MPRNNKDFSEGQGREVLEKTAQAIGIGPGIKDPETGITHVDMPEDHPFWKPMSWHWDQADKDKK